MDFFGFEVFNSGILGVGKFGKYFFGFPKKSEDLWYCLHIPPHSSMNKVNPLWEFFKEI